jgi:hypothetical protein
VVSGLSCNVVSGLSDSAVSGLGFPHFTNIRVVKCGKVFLGARPPFVRRRRHT